MIINKLHINGFGHFKNTELILDSNFNIISGSNEYGKTTIFAFIRAMIFGLKGTKKEIKDDYERYLPIDSPSNFGGSMFISLKGRNFKITRNFLRGSQSFTLIDINDNSTLNENEWFELLAPIDFDIFTSTCYINSETTNPGSQFMQTIQSRIVALAESNSNNIHVENTRQNIQKKIKACNRAIKNLADIDKYKLIDAKNITDENIENLKTNIDENLTKPNILPILFLGFFINAILITIAFTKPFFINISFLVPIFIINNILFAYIVFNYIKKFKIYTDKKLNIDYTLGRIEELKKQSQQIDEKIFEATKIENEYKNLDYQRKALELAYTTIDNISKEIYSKNTDILNANLSKIFTDITDNSYKGIFIADDMIIRGVRHDNTLYELNKFSHGTLEQLYLSLRIVVLDMLYNDYPLPFILDDAFVHYDYKRYKNSLATLEKCNHQVIIFNLSKSVL